MNEALIITEYGHKIFTRFIVDIQAIEKNKRPAIEITCEIPSPVPTCPDVVYYTLEFNGDEMQPYSLNAALCKISRDAFIKILREYVTKETGRIFKE